MILIQESFLDSLILHTIPGMGKSLKFEPNLDLGEGKASERNLKYRQALLKLLENKIYKPLHALSYDEPTYILIEKVDKMVDEYIKAGQVLVKEYLTHAYHQGVDEAKFKLLEVTENEYKPDIAENPLKLKQIIEMQQKNIEDYGLTLRGRLRSTIEINRWME
jgi:hypothetical protein